MSSADAGMSAALLEVMGMVGQVTEAVDGYRAQCVEHGYSPTAAEAMAMDLHRELIRAVFSGVGK